jgi:excisionase family DNA binding protein
MWHILSSPREDVGEDETAMSALLNEQLITPPSTPEESKLARDSSRLLAACIGRGPTARLRVIDADGEIEVPVRALRMLVDILDNMAAGNAVSLVPIHAELTTQQTADFLNVSRPYVVGLLERGELAHHMVGTHRRVYFRDLMDYKSAQLAKSKVRLAELAREAQEQDFY